MDHREKAEAHIAQAEAEPIGFDVTEIASLASAHAVLALIDLIAGDRETEIEQLQQHIAELEQDLAGARDALRRREDITAAEMKALKWGPPDG